MLCKTCQTSSKAPECDSYHKPDGSTSVVGKKACEDSGKGVKVVKDRSSYYLVHQTSSGVSILADVSVVGDVVHSFVEC